MTDRTTDLRISAPPVAGPVGAGLGRRLWASLLDLALLIPAALALGVAAAPLMLLAAPDMADARPDDLPPAAAAISWTLAAALTAAWFWFAVAGRRQATYGMRLAGLRVETLDGERPSAARAGLRWLAATALGLLPGLAYLSIPFTPRRQALHDILTGTVVVKTTVIVKSLRNS